MHSIPSIPAPRVAASLAAVAFLAASLLTSPAGADDWPQFRGPDRDGRSLATGLLKEWPEGGPKVEWTADGLGAGYGSLAIAGDRVWVQGVEGTQSVVHCLRRSDGGRVWTAALGPMLDQDRGPGPRSTPTVEGEFLWALTENGDLACLRAADGAALWSMNILTKFNAGNPGWRISESPLVDGDRLIVTPGGDGGIVALDKRTGDVVWKRPAIGSAGYASAIARNVGGEGGVRLVMNFTSDFGVGVRASDGELMWSYKKAANGTANCTTPVFADDRVFFTSAYDTGGGLLELKAEGGAVTMREAYFTREMDNHHGGVVLHDGAIFGFAGPTLACHDFKTGERLWRDRSVGKGATIFADGMLILLGENNTVGLAEASRAGYVEKGRFTIEDKGWPSWAHPAVCDGALYIRNQGTVTRYDVRAR